MKDIRINTLRVELSGRPRLILPDGRILLLESHEATLLALIALDGPVSRDRVFALLWPDCSRKTAQGNLRQRMFRLRRKTGLDLIVSDDLLTLVPGVAHDLESDATVPGRFLADLHCDSHGALAEWVESVRERLHREGSERLAAQASQLEVEGRLAEAIDAADRLVAREPTLEHAHRRSMRLHYRRGDRAAALQAYQRCCGHLHRLLGTGPSAETEALATLIEESRALLEPPTVPPPAPPPVSLLRPPRLIGRQAAWQAWDEGWQGGRIVLIRGEPGIGKSRLLEDFAAARCLCHIDRAQPGDAHMPYTTWARWLRDWRARFGAPKEAWVDAELARLVPGIGAESTNAFGPLRFRHACFDALVGWVAKGLDQLLIDDLQYADEASLEMLLGWCSKGPRPSVAIAVRSTEMPAALVDWIDAQSGRDQVVDLVLEALDRTDIAALIESLAIIARIDAGAWAEELARSTGGNPFFMIELLRAARRPDGTFPGVDAGAKKPLPGTSQLSRLLQQRLRKLSPEALRLARVAGLAGADFSVELAAATLGVRPVELLGAWAALEDAQIFKGGSFAHDLMQESAAASVPAALARTLHGAIAAALDPARVSSARIAHHAVEAGDWALAASRLQAAARDAFAAVRHREVVDFFDRARDCHERLGDARAAFRVGCLAVDSALNVEAEAALESRTRILLQSALGDAEEMMANIARAKYLGTLFQHAELIPPAERALQLARRLGDDESELLAAGLLAVALCHEGRHQDGIELLRAPAARFNVVAESIARLEFAQAYGSALTYVGRATEAAPWFERALESAERLGRADDLAVLWANLAALRLHHLGQVEGALAAGRRSLALHAEHSEEGGSTPIYAWVALGGALKRAAFWEEAENLLMKALATARSQSTVLIPIIENHLATFYLELGQYARARQTFTAPATRPNTLLRRAVIVARLDARAGAPDVDRLTRLMTEHRYGAGGILFDRLINRLAVALAGGAELAVAMCHELRRESEALGLKALSVAAAARLASASNEVGAHADALHWARVALAESQTAAPYDMDAPELAWHLHLGFSQCQPEQATAVARHALDNVRSGLEQMPKHYRDAYWNRSPFVPELRALLARLAPL